MRCISQTAQKILWICLLGLTIGIILWPVAPSPSDPLPVQSIYAIKHLTWFAVLFMGWALNLAGLLFFAKGNVWERLALCLVFFLVFVQFWGFAVAPWGNSTDSSWLMGHVNYLEHTAKIPLGQAALCYFDFPGLALVGSAIQQLSGADLFLTTRLYLLFGGMIFIIILYVLFLKTLRTPHLAAISVVLAVASSMVLGFIPNQFHPINLATIYIVTFLLLLTGRGTKMFSDQNTIIILLLLIIAGTVEYPFTPILFSMILFASYILSRLTKKTNDLTLKIAVFPLVFFLAWEVYWTIWNFHSNTMGVPTALKGMLNGKWLIPTTMVLRENVGPTYPWWGNIAKFFWWLSVFGFGTLLMLWRSFRWRHANSSRLNEISIFVGILATVLIGFFAGGIIGVVHGGLSRYIWVAPLLLAPVIIEFLASKKRRYPAIIFTMVGLLLLLPTFLTNADTLSTGRVYRSDIDAFESAASFQEKEEVEIIYGFPSVSSVSYIYMPTAVVRNGADIYGGATETDAWNNMERMILAFEAGNTDANLAIISISGKQVYSERLGVALDDPNWTKLEAELDKGERIYDNGNIVIIK